MKKKAASLRSGDAIRINGKWVGIAMSYSGGSKIRVMLEDRRTSVTFNNLDDVEIPDFQTTMPSTASPLIRPGLMSGGAIRFGRPGLYTPPADRGVAEQAGYRLDEIADDLEGF